MIKNNAKAEFKDVQGKNPIILEVNFSEENKDCVKIYIEKPHFIGNKVESIVKYADLFSFCFILASKEQQAKMIPVREELGNQYMKQISVKLTKDLKAGEFMHVNVPINVPKIIEDAILEQKKLLTGDIETPYLTEDNDNV